MQLAPAAMLVPQVLLEMANGPPAGTEMPVNVSAVLSRLVTVTVFAALVLPTASDPKLRLVDENVTGALPLPVRLTVCVPALSVIVRTPEAEPTDRRREHHGDGARSRRRDAAAASVRLAERPGDRDVGHLQRSRAGALHRDVARRAGGPEQSAKRRRATRASRSPPASCPCRSAAASATVPRLSGIVGHVDRAGDGARSRRRERHRHRAMLAAGTSIAGQLLVCENPARRRNASAPLMGTAAEIGRP